MQCKWQILYLGLIVLLGSGVSSMTIGKDEVSPATLQQLKLIKNSIDHTVEPCDNFYAYACGNWEKQEFALGSNSSNHVIFRKNFYKAIDDMLTYNQEHIKKQNQNFSDKVQAFYYSCNNDANFRFFEELKPGNDIEWPLLNDLHGKPATNMEHFDLFAFLGQLFGYGFDNFLLQLSKRREPNGSLYIEVDTAVEAELGINTNYMLMSVGYDYKRDDEKFSKYIDEIDETHNQWLATYRKYNVVKSEVFSYYKVKQVLPQIAKFLDVMLPNQLNHDDVVVIKNIDYLKFLITKEWQPQESRKLCNYAMAVLFKFLAPHYSTECSDNVLSKMHFAVNYMYRQHYFTSEVKAAFNDLKQNIYKYLLEIVNENYLQFNAGQLQAIKDKLSRTYVTIGNVPDIADDAMVAEFYRHMPDLDANNYSKNILLSLKQRFWEAINCPKNMECIEDVGYGTYSVPENDLVIISLASMGPPMYDYSFDPILAVSLMGIFLGHEYAHSIDTDALMDSKLYESKYKEFKNHPNVKASKECTNKQYPETEYHRQLEVDLVGARAAFRAYKTKSNIQPSFTTIPWQQLFFLNYAQYYCKWNEWAFDQTEHVDRTNHVAMNMDAFSQAFKCQEGSKMKPVNKCLLY